MKLQFADIFVNKIKAKTKIHTIKRAGDISVPCKLKFETIKPPRRVFMEGKIYKVQTIFVNLKHHINKTPIIYIDGIVITCKKSLELLAKNDGFENFQDFIHFVDEKHKGYLKGVLIHWTNSYYKPTITNSLLFKTYNR